MKSKERPWALTKEGPIHEVNMKVQNPKKKEKERNNHNNNNNNNKEKRRGSRSGQRKDLGWARGYAARRRIPVRPEDMQQDVCSYFQQKPLKNPTKPGIIFVTHGLNPWDLGWIVREK